MCLRDAIVVVLIFISVTSSVVVAIKVGMSSTLSWWLVPKVAVLAPVTSIVGVVALVLAAAFFDLITSGRRSVDT